jgi:hypothetical protein
LKLHTLIGCFACVLGLTTWSHAQAIPTASRISHLQGGAGFSYAHSDYGVSIKGLTVYGDYDLMRHLGVEGDIHLDNIITPGDIGEKSYLLGPRYRFHFGRITPYAKALFGVGQFQYQYPSYGAHNTTYTYGAYALGGGVDLRASRHINLRPFDIEFEKWPGFKPNGLSPIVMTFGAAYAF